MDDVIQESDAKLEIPPRENKDLAVLQAIIEDNSCDVATQTFDVSFDKSVTQSILPGHEPNLEINKRISHVISHKSRSKKSSFRLFIVPDDSESDAFRESGLQLSFDEDHNRNNEQSLRFSITSNEWKKDNKTQEPLHDYKTTGMPKRSRNAFNHNEFSMGGRDMVSSVNFEKTDRDITIDHQLRQSTNSSVLAWLRLKNFDEREMRKSKKREKKELRRKAYEEAEKRQKRIEESERRYTQWLSAKKKEARRAWRERRARNRVDIAGNEYMIQKDNDPPPNYTVVPSFKGVQAWTENGVSLNTKTSKITNDQITLNIMPTVNDIVNKPETDNDCHGNFAEPGRLLARQNNNKQKLSIGGNEVEDNASHLVDLDKRNDESNNFKTPATADSRILSGSGTNSKLSRRNIYEKWQKQDSYNKRPSTSAGRLTSTNDSMSNKKVKGINHETWLVQKRKKQQSKRATTAKALQVDNEEGKRPNKKLITFEAWKEKKRQEAKEKAKEKKREVVDAALTETIVKMARKRVENSCKEKRQLDTGMPKWQARNRVRSSTGEKDAGITNTTSSKYAVIQLQGNEIDDNGSPATTSLSKEFSTLQQSCENLKLD